MNILFTSASWSDYLYWHKNDKKILCRINELITNLTRNPYEGIGKPEPLKHQLHGCWSRRIDQEHRIVYEILDSVVLIISCRFYY